MKQIELYGRNPWAARLFALVDDEDYELLRRFRWSALKKPSGKIYVRASINGIETYMHQLVLPSIAKNLTPDHVNNNGLDNQKINLRLATRTQQQGNKSKYKCNQSGYKGVSAAPKGKWRARLTVKGISITLGYYNTIEEAARAYNEAAKHHFGEFAKLNEVPSANI